MRWRVPHVLVQVKALLKDRLHGKSGGESTEKSEPSASVELDSRNFDELVLKSKELWIVEFFAPWYVFFLFVKQSSP